MCIGLVGRTGRHCTAPVSSPNYKKTSVTVPLPLTLLGRYGNEVMTSRFIGLTCYLA